MDKKLRQQADFLYLILAALFIASLVVTNLIANKFVTMNNQHLLILIVPSFV